MGAEPSSAGSGEGVWAGDAWDSACSERGEDARRTDREDTLRQRVKEEKLGEMENED